MQAATGLQTLMLRAKAVSIAAAAAEPEEGACTNFPVKEPHLDIVATGVTGVRRQPTLGCRQNTHTQAEHTHTHKTHAGWQPIRAPAATEQTSCIVGAPVSHGASAATQVWSEDICDITKG